MASAELEDKMLKVLEQYPNGLCMTFDWYQYLVLAEYLYDNRDTFSHSHIDRRFNWNIYLD